MSKESLDVHATIVCRFTLKYIRDMIVTYSQLMINMSSYNYHNYNSRRGSSAATFKIECFVIIVNGWKPLTIITK